MLVSGGLAADWPDTRRLSGNLGPFCRRSVVGWPGPPGLALGCPMLNWCFSFACAVPRPCWWLSGGVGGSGVLPNSSGLPPASAPRKPGPSDCAQWTCQVGRGLAKLDEVEKWIHTSHCRQGAHASVLSFVKRQTLCVGNRMKMVKHMAWATTIVSIVARN